MHVETINPLELWNSIEMQNKVQKQSLEAPGTGPTNSTTIDANVPILTTPTSPIMECHDEVRQPEGLVLSYSKGSVRRPPHTTRDDVIHIEYGHISLYTWQITLY